MLRLRSIKVVFVASALLAALAVACSSGDGDGAAAGAASTDAEAEATEEYKLAQQFELSIPMSSTEFNETRRIPRKYSCTKEGVSVPITWGDVPEGTVSVALLMESNEFPGPLWTRWLMWGIPPDARGLPEAVPNTPEVPSIGPQTRQGTNNDKTVGWSGPCPLPEMLDADVVKRGQSAYFSKIRKRVREYFFRLYALDTDITLGSDATKEAFLRAIDGHVLAGGELVGEHVAAPGLLVGPCGGCSKKP